MILLIFYILLRCWMAGRAGSAGQLLLDAGREAAVQWLAAAVFPEWVLLFTAVLELVREK